MDKLLKPVILFRKSFDLDSEFLKAQEHFNVIESRMLVPKNSLVIGRYSVLPFYKELEFDLGVVGSRLINSYENHRYIASMDYYYDIAHLTPKSYFELSQITDNKQFILKGRTNSKKNQWNELMFAKNKQEAINIYTQLNNDPFFHEQGIVIREFVPLVELGRSLSGLPFSNEWRFFFYKNDLICYNFYWSSCDVILKKEKCPTSVINCALEAAKIISQKTNFFVIDCALTQENKAIVIEVNDGQMSGLSENSPEDLYSNLKKYLIF